MNHSELDIEFKYLLVTERDKSFGLSVNTVGVQAIEPKMSYPISTHPSAYQFDGANGRVLHEYQIIYITKGNGTLSFDDKVEMPISKGCLFIIFPGQWHSYKPLFDSGWTEYYVGFEGTFIDTVIQNSFFSQGNQLIDVGINEELVQLFTRAVRIAGEDKIGSQQYLSGIVMHIIGLTLSISKNKMYDEDEVLDKIEQAKVIMNRDVYKKLDYEALAEDLNMSYSWFRKVFRDCTGYAPAKYFQELKLRKAKQLLVESSLSVKEIAYELEYNSLENFFYMFKKTTGFTPSDYRKSARGHKFPKND